MGASASVGFSSLMSLTTASKSNRVFGRARGLEPVRKGLRIRMGRYPAEIAEGAEVYWEGEKGPTSVPFSTTALVN